MTRRHAVLVTVVFVVAASASAATAAPPTPVPTTTPPASTESATEPQLIVGPECADRDDATVTQLADVVVPAIEVAPITTPDFTIDGESIEGLTVDGFTIPEQQIDAGCIIEYDAPGGCLGAVEITGASITDVTIPASVIPAVDLPTGDVVGEQTIAAVVVPGVAVTGVRTEQVCQIEVDGELPTVSRAGVVREGFSRPGAARSGGTRPERCVDGGCVPEIRVEAVRIEPVELPDVDVDPERLQSQDLRSDSDIDVLTGAGEASYVAPGDVLFDTDQAAIRSDAGDALIAIVEEINATAPPGSPIRVEGHTDDRADEAHNLDLSQRRAQAVADWLVATGGIDAARIAAIGLGEASPAYPNDTDEHRQLNRRVVITVLDS